MATAFGGIRLGHLGAGELADDVGGDIGGELGSTLGQRLACASPGSVFSAAAILAAEFAVELAALLVDLGTEPVARLLRDAMRLGARVGQRLLIVGDRLVRLRLERWAAGQIAFDLVLAALDRRRRCAESRSCEMMK